MRISRFLSRPAKIDLIKLEFWLGNGTCGSIDAPREDVEQIEYGHCIEILVDNNRFGRKTWSLGLYNRFVETAPNFRRIGKCDVFVLSAVDR